MTVVLALRRMLRKECLCLKFKACLSSIGRASLKRKDGGAGRRKREKKRRKGERERNKFDCQPNSFWFIWFLFGFGDTMAPPFMNLFWCMVLGKMIAFLLVWRRRLWSYSSPAVEFLNGSKSLLNTLLTEVFANRSIHIPVLGNWTRGFLTPAIPQPFFKFWDRVWLPC